MNDKKLFVRVQSTYAPKNKLSTQIITALSAFNGTLFLNDDLAIRTLDKLFMDVCKQYLKSGGKAMLPTNTIYRFDGGIGFMVEDTIVINGHYLNQEIMEAE